MTQRKPTPDSKPKRARKSTNASTTKRTPRGRRVGRPSPIDDAQVRSTICDRIRVGLSDKDAALTAGIGETTFYRWMRTGEDHEIELRQLEHQHDAHERGDADVPALTDEQLDRVEQLMTSTYRQFRQDVIQARAECKLTLITRVRTAAQDPKHWRAAMGLLVAKWPEEFGRRQIELSGVGGAPIEATVRTEPVQPLDSEAVERMAEVMARAGLIPIPEQGDDES